MTARPESASGAQARAARSAQRARSPRALTGGEEKCQGIDGKALIDWLNVTLPEAEWHANTFAPMVIQWLEQWTGVPITGEGGNGLHGFSDSVRLYGVAQHQAVVIGFIAWGGESQRGRAMLSLNGTGCSLVRDWHVVHSWLEARKARITRVDVAVDALDGEFTVEQARDWYAAGSFAFPGKIAPKYDMAGQWGEVNTAGRTFYVGRRANGKFARIYEKGKQLGNCDSPWTRFEVEVHNVDREIPLDVLIRPASYFAGMYPITQKLVNVGAERIRTIQAEQEISLERLMTFGRLAYGRLVHVLRLQAGGDDTAVANDLCVVGIPRRLEKAALHMFRGLEPPILGGSHESVCCH